MTATALDPPVRAGVRRGWFMRMARHVLAPAGLRCHLSVMVLLGLLPPVVALCVGGFLVVQEAHQRTLQDAALAAAVAVDRELASLRTVGSVLSQPGLLSGFADLRSAQKLADAFAASLHIDLVVWRDTSGRDRSWRSAQGGELAAPGEAAAAERALATASVVTVGHGQRPDISVFVLIDAASATVLQASLPLDHLTRMLPIPADLAGTSAFLVTGDGQAIAGPTALGGDPRALPAWLRDGKGWRPSGVTTGGSGADATMAAFATPSLAPEWRVVIVQPMASVQRSQSGPLVLIGLLTVFSIVVAGVASLWIGTWLATPLRQLTATARALAAGTEFRSRSARSNIAEIEELQLSVARAYEMSRRRAAAERLALGEARTGQELLASVINGTADLINVKDLDLALVLLNRAALLQSKTGYGEWQFLGRRVGEFLPADEAKRSEDADREVIKTGERRNSRLERPNSDGTVTTYVVTKTPWRDLTGRIAGVVTVLHDVSDHRTAEERLAVVQAELMRATRLSTMGAMASGLAHELNQPLAAATNFINAAARMLLRDPPEPFLLAQARVAVADAGEQTLRAGSIVRRLRDFVGRGESELKVERVDELVYEIRRVACAGGAMNPRHIVVRNGARDVEALVDGTQIQQVLLNLIRNASEAIGDGSQPRIELSWRRTQEMIEVTVADNGPGLAAEIRDRLFEPFASTKALGMGIGLAICRTIIEGHGGTLVAEDNPTGGALFRITLPPVHQQPHTRSDTTECTSTPYMPAL